jgi:hypothetical protein
MTPSIVSLMRPPVPDGRGRRTTLADDGAGLLLGSTRPGDAAAGRAFHQQLRLERSHQIKPLIAGLRWVLLLGSVLVFLAGVQLYVLSEQTDDFFAWTINPPLTAAFLGAFYWTALVLATFSARKQDWAHARLGVVGIFLFVTLSLVTTLLHLDRFHFSSVKTSAAFAAWAWLAIYIVDPVLVLLFSVRQLQIAGGDPPRARLLPPWYRAALVLEGSALLAIGITLFLIPEQVGALWPWTLSMLTARSVASWLIGMSVILIQAAWENDWDRIGAGLYSSIVLGTLQLVAVARYPALINGDATQDWIYVAFLVVVLTTGVYGALASRR